MFDYGIFTPGCRATNINDMKRLDLEIDKRMPHLRGDRLFPGWSEAVARLNAAAKTIQ